MRGRRRSSHFCRNKQFGNKETAFPTFQHSRLVCSWKYETMNIIKREGESKESMYRGGWLHTSTSLSLTCSFSPRLRTMAKGGKGAIGLGVDDRGEWCVTLFFSWNFRKAQAPGHSRTQHYFRPCVDWTLKSNETRRSKPECLFIITTVLSYWRRHGRASMGLCEGLLVYEVCKIYGEWRKGCGEAFVWVINSLFH